MSNELREEAQTLDGPSAPHDRTTTMATIRRRALVALGGFAAIALSLVAVDLITNDTESAHAEFDEPIQALTLDVSNGSVTVVATDASSVGIEIEVHGGLRKPHHSEIVSGDTLIVRAGCSWGPVSPTCSVDYTIRVPAEVAITARGDGTSYDFDSMTGDVDVSLNGGDADLGFAAVPRHVRARTNGGDIKIALPDNDVPVRVDADTDGGSVHIDIRTDPMSDRLIDAHSNGGSIRIGYLDEDGS